MKVSADDHTALGNCNAALISALDPEAGPGQRIQGANQLFNDLQLIKVEGRPTLYLSKDVIVGEYHFNKFPKSSPEKKT